MAPSLDSGRWEDSDTVLTVSVPLPQWGQRAHRDILKTHLSGLPQARELSDKLGEFRETCLPCQSFGSISGLDNSSSSFISFSAVILLSSFHPKGLEIQLFAGVCSSQNCLEPGRGAVIQLFFALQKHFWFLLLYSGAHHTAHTWHML